MTLSSFLLRPAQTATFTTIGLTNQVVTASPAIFFGAKTTTLSFYVNITITNGSNGNVVFRDTIINNGASPILMPNGVDCPNGIYITTAIASGTPTGMSSQVYYILK
jgi:hypothetical protein